LSQKIYLLLHVAVHGRPTTVDQGMKMKLPPHQRLVGGSMRLPNQHCLFGRSLTSDTGNWRAYVLLNAKHTITRNLRMQKNIITFGFSFIIWSSPGTFHWKLIHTNFNNIKANFWRICCLTNVNNKPYDTVIWYKITFSLKTEVCIELYICQCHSLQKSWSTVFPFCSCS